MMIAETPESENPELETLGMDPLKGPSTPVPILTPESGLQLPELPGTSRPLILDGHRRNRPGSK